MVDGKTVGVEYVHENARLAAEYMRGVIAEAEEVAGRPGIGSASTPPGAMNSA